MTTIPPVEDFFKSQVNQLFKVQKSAVLEIGKSTVKQRKAKLKKLATCILANKSHIEKALKKDLNKHPTEAGMMEIFPVLSEIRHARKHLSKWVDDRPVPTPLALLGTSSYIRYESKGQILILAPWNFPFYLTLSPLISAICGGNVCILKPSEFTPSVSQLLKEMISSIFEEKEIGVIEGDHRTAAYLTSLPFNHIFFTGAPSIGKKVMAAAAENLASITLELGGKSPVVTDATTHIPTLAKRLAWAKLLNAGQTCVAPDFLLVPESLQSTWVQALKEAIHALYGTSTAASEDYGQIVNEKNKARVESYLQDALAKGAQAETLGHATTTKVPPCILTNVRGDMKIMNEEIFGPLLPIVTYENEHDLLEKLQGHPPLSLYIISNSHSFIKKILENTRAGSTAINHFVLQLSHHELPFGGLNFSGVGRSHGYMGFLEFVNQRPVLKQKWPISFTDFLSAPYTPLKQRLVNLIMRWL